MEKTTDQAVSGRKGTPGPFPEAFLAALPVIACFLGGATAKWGEGIVVALLGIFLIFRPPRYSLGPAINLIFLIFLLWAAIAFLPATWFFKPAWRTVFIDDFGISLPTTLSPQPWITLTCWFSLLAGMTWLYVVCAEDLGLHEARTALRMFTAGIAFLATICVLLWLRHTTAPFWHNARNFGPFPNRNQTGNLFGLTAMMILACGQDDLRKGRKRWILWATALGFVIAAIILNFSRAGVGILVAGSALWLGIFSLRQRSPSKLAIVASLLLLLGTALLIFGGQTMERFHLRNLGSIDVSTDFRWKIFSDAFQLLRDSPWVGIGLGNFESVFATFRAASFNEQRALHPESDWLWTWSELGWPAVVLIVVGFVLLTRKVFPLQEGTNQRYRLATFIAAILFALHGFVDVSGHRVGTMFAAIFLLGLSIHRPMSCRPIGWMSILFRLTGLILIIVGVSWTVSARGKKLLPGSVGVSSAKRLAVMANQEHDFKEAISLTNTGLHWAPLDWELYFSRAIAEVPLKQTDNALLDFRRARFLEPSSYELPFAEGTAWLQVKQPALAATAWQEALRRASGTRAGVYARMLSNASLRSPELSRILAERGVSRHDLAMPYLSQLTGAEFNRAVNEVLQHDPDLSSYSEPEKLALLSLWSERGEGETLARAIEQHPDWLSDAWFGIAKFDASKTDFRGAYDLAQKYGEPAAMPRLSPSSSDLMRLESQFRSSPDNYAIGYELYRAQKQAGRIDDALQTVRHFSERKGTPAYWKYLEAQLWAEKQNYDRAWNAWLKFHETQNGK